jgi:predicted metal-dependent HD superfamily phosphohydrolase
MNFTQYFEELFGIHSKKHLHIFLNEYNGRPYHSEKHIWFMLKLYEKYKHHLNDSVAVLFAILYHDIIYDSQAETGANEHASEKFLYEHVQSDICKHHTSSIIHARRMILATINHISNDTDCDFFLDCDLAILSENYNDVVDYDNAIRQEYSWVSEELYIQGRSKVLSNFLNRDKIFHSEMMLDRNDKAKNNLKKLLEKYNA